MSDDFSTPASATGIKWDELKGSLLLVEPISVEAGIPTAYGEANAVKANVIVLDGDLAETSYTETLIFPKVLQSQVKPRIGSKVLGRLGQGQKKPGQSAPWMLLDATEPDKATARAYLAKATDAPF